MLGIELRTFGFKYGVPDTNNYIDVSFLQNPARKFGLSSSWDERHVEFMKQLPEWEELLQVLQRLAEFIIKQGDRPMLALGCSAGRHRSVTVAEELAERLRAKGYRVSVTHKEANHA